MTDKEAQDGAGEDNLDEAGKAEDQDTGGQQEASQGSHDKGAGEEEKRTSEAGNGEEGDKGEDEKPGLPDDWREIAAAGDESALKLARRYGSMSGILKALKEAQDTIRSGKLKRDMPDPSDEKAMAEWRKAEGIPDDPTGYKLPEAVQKRIVDEDKPMLSSFTEFAHKKGAGQAVVDVATEWYIETMEAMEAERTAKDKEASEAVEDALRKDWAHSEYKANTQLAGRFLESIPGLGGELTEARLPNGRRLGDNAAFVAWAAEMGRDKFGDVAFATSDSEKRHSDRKAEIEKIIGTDEYYERGLDKEYAQLVERELKRKK